MSEREAFEKVLKENPLDDTTRLVYADWLEENGFDDEAVRMRKWRAAYDYMAYLAKECGGTCVNYETASWIEYQYENLSTEEIIQAGHDYIEHGEYLTQVGGEWLSNHVDRKEYWKNWEIITGVTPPKTDKWGYDIGVPFSCSC